MYHCALAVGASLGSRRTRLIFVQPVNENESIKRQSENTRSRIDTNRHEFSRIKIETDSLLIRDDSCEFVSIRDPLFAASRGSGSAFFKPMDGSHMPANNT